MKTVKVSVLAVMVLFGAAVAADAFANGRGHGGGGHRGGGGHYSHGSRVSVGFAIGGPAFWYGAPYYYRPYYAPYYYPYPVAVGAPAYPAYAAGPAAYVEQGQPAPTAAAPAAAYWYYCNESQAYYPYVNQCAGPWQRVAPQPPPS